MSTTPLPPLPELRGGIFKHTTLGELYDRLQVEQRMVAYARQARADLEAENAALRFELQTAKDVNIAVVNRQQAEIEALKKKLAQARQDEADAVRAADAVYEAQERAADAYRAGSSGY